MSLVLDVNGLSIRMAHSLRKTPTRGVPRWASSFFRDSGSTHSRRAETDGVLSARLLGPPVLPSARSHGDPRSGSDPVGRELGITLAWGTQRI